MTLHLAIIPIPQRGPFQYAFPSEMGRISFTLGANLNPDVPFIQSVEVVKRKDGFPFTIPAIRSLKKLEFHKAVTYITGDNGSGKSTLMEAIALGLRINPEGGNRNTRFSTLKTESDLVDHIVVNRNGKRIKDAFFFRAETMFNLQIAANADHEENGSYSWMLNGYSGLQNRSHGEGHLDLIRNKMSCGVYLFDEPESGLSISRQFEFLCEMKRLVDNGSQLIVATHSPVILSYPECMIYELGNEIRGGIEFVETDAFRLTKLFINGHKGFVKQLFTE